MNSGFVWDAGYGNESNPDWAVTDRLGTMARVVVATGGGTSGNYSMIAFASWDYGSLGEKQTKLKQKNILYRLQVGANFPGFRSEGCVPAVWLGPFIEFLLSSCQVDLEEERLKKQAAALTVKQKIFLYSLRIILFFIALGLIIGALVGIFMATQFSQVNGSSVERSLV